MATVADNSAALNLIAGMAAVAKTKKGKDTKPEINDPSLADTIEEYIKRKAEADTAEALRDAAAGQIVMTVRPKRLEICAALGKVVASVSVNGRLTFTQTCRYSSVPEGRAEALSEAFGESLLRYFKPTLSIGLKKDSANNEAVLTNLVESLGADFFAAHFEVKRDLLVQEAFHNDYSTRPEVTRLAQPFIDEETIRPYSPSLKVA